jgi:hypothetical protein
MERTGAMTFAEFSNGLRILHSIDGHELPGMSEVQIRAFISNPVQFLIRADDPTAAIIWQAVEKRQKPAVKP